MKEKAKDEIEVIINDFTHDISRKDLNLLRRTDVYGEDLNKYFAESDRIGKLNEKAKQQVFSAISNNKVTNIEVIINNLGYDIIQPDLRLIESETNQQYDEHISEINQMSNQAFNAILNIWWGD